MVCNKKRKPVFIKRKWNHVVFSRVTILSLHPVNKSNQSWWNRCLKMIGIELKLINLFFFFFPSFSIDFWECHVSKFIYFLIFPSHFQNAGKAVTFQWVKGDGQNFIRTTKQQYMFISANGRLYFSEVSPDDQGNYRCLVTLAGTIESEMTTHQPPSRVSRNIPLIVEYARK